ncbi:MAG: DNA-directed RNA polymerase subunit P [Thermoprotei archaeon]|uniref:DNA-directed RNA polymerase subunit Rpo12 n=1 Tax=Fervidicoccus fontis TaxID=683846 RepID=A0A7J3SJM8_9CREN|nr:DNA-directed RNA polymerase subunit P [Thermoprotei archaeon]
MEEQPSVEGVTYVCARCGRELRPQDFELLHSIKCVYCGSKIVYKVRKPYVKRIKAI